MKKIYLSLSFIASFLSLSQLNAQTGAVTLTAGAGAPVSYGSIGAAYAAIPSATTTNYLIELLPAYTGSLETYPIQLTDKGLLTGGATITIRPAAGNNGEVIQPVTPAAGVVVLQFNGADNVVLDGRPGGVAGTATNYLTVNDPISGSSTNRNVELLNGANNNTIQYINSTAADATSAALGSRNILIGSTTTTGNKNNTIQYCVVTGGLRGIQDFGLSDAVPNTGNIIKFNTVRNFGAIGIFAGSGQSNITIQNNTVSMAGYNVLVTGTTVSIVGIQQQQAIVGSTSTITDNTISLVTTSATVTAMSGIVDIGVGTESILRNTITTLSAPSSTSLIGVSAGSSTTGNILNIIGNKMSDFISGGAVNARGFSIFPFLGSTVNLNNNFVSLMQDNPSAAAIFGILMGNSSGSSYTSNIYYNTVRIGGTEDLLGTGSAYGIFRGDTAFAAVYNQRNNVSIMQRSGGASTARFIGFNLGSVNGTLNIDYNTYYASDSTGNGFAAGGWDGFIYRNGGNAAYKAGAGVLQEKNTNFKVVNFVSNTDLHLAGTSITDTALAGKLIIGITTDIDGQSRSTTFPTKGADEGNMSLLPVVLSSFSGVNKEGYNQLTWTTASENNSLGFEVQRSADGNDFSTIGFVKSKAENGSAATTLTYVMNDEKPFNGISYYRLKQLDKDGKFTYSTIISIKGKLTGKLEIASLYPNPVSDRFNVIITSEKAATLQLAINDVTGKTVYTNVINALQGTTALPINASAFAPGTYQLTAINAVTGEHSSVRFVK